MRNFATLGLSLFALAACSDQPFDDSGPAIDPTAPRINITSPERGTFAGDVESVEVRGTATDDTVVTSVTINGITASVQADGSFVANVPVTPGTNLLHAVAKDAEGNLGKETRAVVAGSMQRLDRTIESAITMTISAQTFDAIGRGAATFVTEADLTSLIAPMNPVVDMGTTNGQPDCLYGQARTKLVDIGDADISLVPVSGGLMLDATLDNVRVDLALAWAVSCLDGSRDVRVTANRVRVQAMLGAGQDFFGNITFTMTDPDAQLVGFNVDMGGVPQTIIDLLDLDTRMGPVLAWATERFVTPMLNDTLAGLNQTKSIDLLGKTIDVTVFPTQLDFDLSGALVAMDSELRAQGDTGEFVFVDNLVPAMDKSRGFQLAIADDAANQLLTSFWSAKGMELALDLETGPYGAVGTLYDSVELSAKVPPFLDASGDGLQLAVGDLVASFKKDGNVVTMVAINAKVALKVASGQDGALRLDVGTPEVFVDILDENIDGANSLSNADFEAITSFALERVVSFGGGAVGAIPLPAAGGVAVKNVSVGEQTGYLVVNGEIQ
jgi:hypothetical protein